MHVLKLSGPQGSGKSFVINCITILMNEVGSHLVYPGDQHIAEFVSQILDLRARGFSLILVDEGSEALVSELRHYAGDGYNATVVVAVQEG